MTIFSKRIKELRLDHELSQRALATALSTTNSGICDWECGRSEPSLDSLVRAALYFGVSTDYLLGLEDETGAKTYIVGSFNNFNNSGTFKI